MLRNELKNLQKTSKSLNDTLTTFKAESSENRKKSTVFTNPLEQEYETRAFELKVRLTSQFVGVLLAEGYNVELGAWEKMYRMFLNNQPKILTVAGYDKVRFTATRRYTTADGPITPLILTIWEVS